MGRWVGCVRQRFLLHCTGTRVGGDVDLLRLDFMGFCGVFFGCFGSFVFPIRRVREIARYGVAKGGFRE